MKYTIEKLKELSNSIADCRKILSEIDSNNEIHRRIAILSNYTLQGISDCLRVKSLTHRFSLEIYEGQYNQWRQEILGDDLYNFHPEIIVIIVDFFDIMEKGYFEYGVSTFDTLIDGKVKFEELSKYIEIIKSRSKAKVVIANAVKPSVPLMGIIENKFSNNYTAGIDLYNNNLNQYTHRDSQLLLFDMDRWLSRIGKDNSWNTKYLYLADMRLSPEFFPIFAEEFMHFLVPLFGKKKKCIIIDLDNTIWGGIIGEDGIANIELGPTGNGKPFLLFQKLLKFYKNRGIILAICSKNNERDVDEVFNTHPYMILQKNDFVAQRINWLDKASNIKSIVEELNISLESVVFIDDDPINTQLVRESLDQVDVITLPADRTMYVPILLEYKELSTFEYTDEDSRRTDMYLSEKKRKELEKISINIDNYLDQLDIKLYIKCIDDMSFVRSVQLTQKTNQFNLTTLRYTEEMLKEILDEKSNHKAWTLQVTDRYGDHGIVGLCIVRDRSFNWEIDTFLLSCRVLGRKIETDFLNWIVNYLKKEKYNKIVAKYIPTPKNIQVKDFYKDSGFDMICEDNMSSVWELLLERHETKPFRFTIIK